MTYYNRYATLTDQGEVVFFPDIKLDEKESDKFEIYEAGKSRLDKWSDKHYDSPYYGALIMMANPELVGLEHLIPDGSAVRIPYPLEPTIKELKRKVEEKRRYYGN